jgi:predicted TIM-barrel fold metal-dependent hydrolase
MDYSNFLDLPVIDGHIHFAFPVLRDDYTQVIRAARFQRVNLVSTPDAVFANHNPAAIYYKSLYPDTTYICGAMDYFAALSAGPQGPQVLGNQVRQLHAVGFDGIKLLETKPMVRKMLKIPLDSPMYEPMWAAIEELGMPVVWHVADPEEFWDPNRCPGWAKQNGWYYGDGTYPTLESLYTEVDNILSRHPGLKVILAHFFFLSEHLERAAAFLDAHPHAHFDLTPGSEMFFNFTRQKDQARDFFVRYSHRLVFGSDIGGSAIEALPKDGLNQAESLARAWVVREFLESDRVVDIPEGVSHWRRPGQQIEGIALPVDVLHLIYHGNFERLFGLTPRILNLGLAKNLTTQLAAEIDAAAKTETASPARWLAKELQNA